MDAFLSLRFFSLAILVPSDDARDFSPIVEEKRFPEATGKVCIIYRRGGILSSPGGFKMAFYSCHLLLKHDSLVQVCGAVTRVAVKCLSVTGTQEMSHGMSLVFIITEVPAPLLNETPIIFVPVFRVAESKGLAVRRQKLILCPVSN